MTAPSAPGPLARYLIADHERLDRLLQRALAPNGNVEPEVWSEFRRGLLRHIGIEEKIVVPAVRRTAAGVPAVAARLRLDHGALAALLVPTPRPAVVRAVRGILTAHNALEEGPGGFYALCEASLGPDLPQVAAAASAAPEVPVSPHVDGPLVEGATRRALARAGYALEDETDGG